MIKTFVMSLLSGLSICAWAQKSIDLSGRWQFQIDRNNSVSATSHYDDNITLPGSMLTNGKGDAVSVDTKWVSSLYDSSYFFNPYMRKYRVEGNVKFPFFLTPDKHYVGTAWYRRSVKVPKTWAKQRVLLTLERPHIETTLYINGKEVGHQMSLSAPHIYDVTSEIVAGKENTIAIKIYNGIENVCVGQDSHSVTDQTQGDWNGIIGRMSLDCRPVNYIKHVDVYPNIRTNTIDIVVRGGVKNPRFYIDGALQEVTQLNDSTYGIALLGERCLWDEYNPKVYHLDVKCGGDKYSTVFGMREIKTNGRHIMLNNKEMFVRGTVGNCCFPETGYPPTDVASWAAIIKKCKSYGLNTMRFHSYCPPEAAFIAADSLGFYLQPEGPSWPNHGVRLKRKMHIDTYLMDDTKAIVEAYGNHPSFVMLSAGNEPAGDWVTWCNEWVEYWKNTDSRRIYCGANVGGGWAWDSNSQYHVKGGARGLDWDRHAPQSADNFNEMMLFPRNYKDTIPNNTPIISHEQGQWCAFPDLKERTQYKGVYKAKNFDIFEDLLTDNGMSYQADKFLRSSGKLQVLCYKYEMERNFRTKDYSGFVLLGLNDYSGQGTALVGPLNVHWKEKGYVDSTQWKEFCNDVVPLARFPKFVYSTQETETIPVEVYNASSQILKGAMVRYSITSDDGHSCIDKGVVNDCIDIPAGKNNEIEAIYLALSSVAKPKMLTLCVEINANNKTWKNHWDFWVYPPVSNNELNEAKRGIYISDSLDAEAIAVLKKGGKVLLTAAGKVRYGDDIKQTYLPVFWNTSWFKMRPPHTTGAYINTRSHIYDYFPTEDWTNLNWWELMNKAQVMNLAEFPANYQPPMQPIDTWHVSRKCGMIVEANVLSGKVLMTTMDITSNLDSRLVARQMRLSILRYMQSPFFSPSISVEPETITNLYNKQAPSVNMFTKDSPDELKPALK